MNLKQLDFVMDRLRFKGDRRGAMVIIIINGKTAYSAEQVCDVPKATAARDAAKCIKTWEDMLYIYDTVRGLTS